MIGTRPLRLPRADGSLEQYVPGAPSAFPLSAAPPRTRVAYAAAHVVCDPLANIDPWLETAVDWEATLAYRRHLWELGFAVAEAMDTAQRGMGLDWPMALELIKRSTEAAKTRRVLVASGAGTDHLPPGKELTLQDVTSAYLEQCEAIEAVD